MTDVSLPSIRGRHRRGHGLAWFCLLCGFFASHARAQPGAPSAPSAADSELPVAMVRLGTREGPTASAATVWERRDFQLGEPLLLLVELAGAAPSARIEVTWRGPGGEALHSENLTAGGEDTRVLLRAETSGWKPGEHMVEIRMNGQLTQRYPFTMFEAYRGPGNVPPQEKNALIEVYYGTNRAPSGKAQYEDFYGSRRMPGDKVNLGVCEVSVPLAVHVSGEIERPVWWTLDFEPDTEKHIVITDLDTLPPGTFYRRLSSAVDKTTGQQVFVFIHGFNVDFTQAVLRAAQMAHDLKFDGVPMIFSWPSHGQISLARYLRDEKNAEAAVPHLERFLNSVAELSAATRIHLIAHSMGNQPLMAALQRIAARRAEDSGPIFDQIVLTAPDIDADVFTQLAREFTTLGDRTTLYASSNDLALNVSRRFYGHSRAGDTKGRVVVVPGVDTIDVSEVDTSMVGHSYYGDNRFILSDVFYLLKRMPPKDRAGLIPWELGGSKYWVFQP